MQFMDQGKGDDIPHLMWSWVLPLEKKIRQNECRTEIKHILTMKLRMNFFCFFSNFYICKCKQPTMLININ